jgi:hypothetical protein
MQESTTTPPAKLHFDGDASRIWRRKWQMLFRSVIAVVMIGLACCSWLVIRGIKVSIEAEHTLHATLMTIRVVEQFVDEYMRWPSSWEELERLSQPREWGMYKWPDSSSEIQRRVVVDFNADLPAIASQDQSEFSAIRPIGPYYEYRHYISDLQAAVRRSLVK